MFHQVLKPKITIGIQRLTFNDDGKLIQATEDNAEAWKVYVWHSWPPGQTDRIDEKIFIVFQDAKDYAVHKAKAYDYRESIDVL